MRYPLATLLLALSLSASAAEHPCKPLSGIGCWYAPEAAGDAPPLLVYIRGHHLRIGPNVPAGRWLDSSRDAFDTYKLGESADAARYAVLVTYRSDVAVDEAVIARLARESGRAFARRVVAAHSGGYVGLGKALDNGLQFERVILLDSFYSGSPALAQKVQTRFPSGACRGFYTPHSFPRRDGSRYENEANFRANFRPHAGGCAVDRLAGGEHNSGVNRCLLAYLRDASCQP